MSSVEATNDSVYIKDIPEETNLWKHEGDIIYKLFKLRMCECDVDTILWPGDQYSTNLNKCFPKITHIDIHGYYETLFEFLDCAFQKLDIDELTWYSSSEIEREVQAEGLLSQILHNVGGYITNMRSVDKVVSQEIARTEARISPFLSKLRTILELNYDDIYEKPYEELFACVINVVGFIAYSGEVFSKLTFQYEVTHGDHIETKTVFSQPDLLVYNTTGNSKPFAVGVVKVKKDNEINKALKHRNELQGDDARGGCCNRMTEEGVANGDGISDCSLMEADYKNGELRLLTTEEEKNISAFLPELLGEVAACVNCPKLKLQTVPQRNVQKGHIGLKSVIGFGVVGFKVYVVNFMCASRDEGLERGVEWHFHLVPCIQGLGIDVLISRSLNILKRHDRNKLFRLLYALKIIAVKDF